MAIEDHIVDAMCVLWVSNGKLEGQLPGEHEKAHEEANTHLVSAMAGALAGHLQDMYFCNKTDNDLWDALNNNYGGLDAGTKLYIIEQYHNYKMVDEKGMVEQSHDIQCMVKELELLKIIVPDEFVAGGIIAKLPPSWRDFATTHMRYSHVYRRLDCVS
jgi:hypothetical protein